MVVIPFRPRRRTLTKSQRKGLVNELAARFFNKSEQKFNIPLYVHQPSSFEDLRSTEAKGTVFEEIHTFLAEREQDTGTTIGHILDRFGWEWGQFRLLVGAHYPTIDGDTVSRRLLYIVARMPD